MKLATKFFLICSILFFIFSLCIIWVYYGISRKSILDLEKQTLLSLPIVNRGQDSQGNRSVSGQQFFREQLLSSVFIGIVEPESQDMEVIQDPLDIADRAESGLFIVDDIYYFGVYREHQGQTYLYVKEMRDTGKTLTQLLTNSIYFSAIFTILAGVISFLLARYFSAPITDISLKVAKLNSEELSYRFVLSANKKDEINVLKHSLNTMLEKLEFGFMIQKRFTADASHELRTPVTSLLGYSKMLKEWGYSDPQITKEALERIHLTAETMKRLIEDLLLLSKAEKEEITLKTQNKRDLMVYIEEYLEPLSVERSIVFTDIGFPDSFSTSLEYLSLLLKILTENALKFSPPESSVDVLFESDRISIRDNGIGIRESVLPHLFDRFYKATGNTDKTVGSNGFGLGLSIAKEIANLLQLNILVESEIGKGTIVSVFELNRSIQASTFRYSIKAFND
jgi:signal transduction histidine kinase